MRAASFFPLSYNETRPERGGDSAPWTGHAPCRPAASAQTEKLQGENIQERRRHKMTEKKMAKVGDYIILFLKM